MVAAEHEREGPDPRFGGIARAYGNETLARLRASRVCVIGLGGVGSWTVEALVRTGVGHLTLVDLDEVCITNTNRQIHALSTTVGRTKASVLAERAVAIHPGIQVDCVEDFFTATSADATLGDARDPARYDVVVDAIDSFKNKCLLVEACRARRLPIVVVGGAGGRVDPTRIRLDDISRSEGDRLLAMLRKRLRQEHGFPRHGKWGIPCVFSDEPKRFPDGLGGVCEVKPESQESVRLDCHSGFGAVSFVTGTFGFFAAKATVDLLLRK